MPPQLPVELLRIIVDNFRLPPFSSQLRTRTLERDIQSTLYSLCLTSRTLSEIARPLLFGFVRIVKDTAVETLASLIGNNGGSNLLTLVRQIVYEDSAGTDSDPDEEELEEELVEVWFDRLYSLAHQIEEVVVHSDCYRFRNIPGFGLKRLFLNGVYLQSQTMSAFAFPSLEVLGLCDIAFGTIPLALPTFPSLRHVILDRLEEHTLAVLTGLLASLDSIILRPDHFLEARSAIGPEFPVDKVLVNLPWQWGSDEAEEEFVVNLRLLAPDLRSTHSGALQEIVDDYTSLFEEDAQFYPRLETIYLPLVDSLAGNHDREESQAGLERLASACRKRKVEVVFEEQHWAIDCECQVSEDFMRRMTKKRIMRENGET